MKKKVIWLAVTLILGALGSGLWELAFRPLLALIGTAGLHVVTLGLESLRNGLYEEAARGQYERVGITILSATAGFLTGITAVVLLLPILRRKARRDREGGPEAGMNAKRFRGALVLVFTTTMAVLLFQRTAYINRAANYFEQLTAITAPYLTESERLQFRSRFAQVATREQYLALVSELRSVAKSNRANVPDFTIY